MGSLLLGPCLLLYPPQSRSFIELPVTGNGQSALAAVQATIGTKPPPSTAQPRLCGIWVSGSQTCLVDGTSERHGRGSQQDATLVFCCCSPAFIADRTVAASEVQGQVLGESL